MYKNRYLFSKNERLPKDGWFQSCISCKYITARIIERESNNERFIIYVCSSCKKNTEDIEKQITSCIDKYFKRRLNRSRLPPLPSRLTRRRSQYSSVANPVHKFETVSDLFENETDLHGV